MTDPIAVCATHGYYSHPADGQETCPDCGTAGEPVLSGRRRRQLSTYLSGALRHFPDDAGLRLDRAGWAAYEALVDSVERRYDWAGEPAVSAVVATDPKGRFETREPGGTKRIRAAYGHSVDVDLDWAHDDDAGREHDDDIPETLYHGTAPRNLDTIGEDGLKPMGRQCVHLSGSQAGARAVGQRHADDPVVLAVDVRGLESTGHAVRKRGTDTYTVDHVPPRFLTRPTNV